MPTKKLLRCMASKIKGKASIDLRMWLPWFRPNVRVVALEDVLEEVLCPSFEGA